MAERFVKVKANGNEDIQEVIWRCRVINISTPSQPGPFSLPCVTFPFFYFFLKEIRPSVTLSQLCWILCELYACASDQHLERVSFDLFALGPWLDRKSGANQHNRLGKHRVIQHRLTLIAAKDTCFGFLCPDLKEDEEAKRKLLQVSMPSRHRLRNPLERPIVRLCGHAPHCYKIGRLSSS